MRRALVIALAFAPVGPVGCRAQDPVAIAGLKAEIATIASEACVPGPRTPAQVARIQGQRAKAQLHVDDVDRGQ